MLIPEVRLWAEHTFGAAALGDPRRTRRLVTAAAQIALHPQLSFPQIFDWNQLRGFYRMCAQRQATLAAIQQPHWLHTRQAMTQHPLVLILHDTTEMDYSSHHALTGAGPIGNGGGQGFLQHNSLAVVPGDPVLGLSYQQWQVRRPAPAHETAYQRKRRVRESQHWAVGFRAAGVPPEGCCWVDIADRASDDYEAMRAAWAVGHHFLVRATQNRVAYIDRAAGAERVKVHVLDYAATLPMQTLDYVEIPGRGGRPARTARVYLAGAPVWLPAPAGTPQRAAQPLRQVWLLRIWEPHPPAAVEEPLEWRLLCSLPTTTADELLTRRDWYSQRTLIETYHDIEKNGCSEEDRRFETAARMEACVAVLAVVAVRVLQLRQALATVPEAAAEEVGTAAESAVLRRWLHQLRGRFTVRDFVRGVARLGGFLGRKCDGEPGVRALWRGYQRLQDMLVGYGLHAPDPSG